MGEGRGPAIWGCSAVLEAAGNVNTAWQSRSGHGSQGAGRGRDRKEETR